MTINQQLIRDEVKDYILLTLGLALYAAAFTVFLMPYEIVTGGVTGLSAIIYYATQFKLENTYMIINAALLGVALKILGLKFMMKTIYAIIVLYFMLKFAQELMPVDASGHFVKILGEDQKFMSLIVGCCITGTGMAMVFLNGGSMGGTDIVAACINKYKNISLGQVLMAVDICIIGSCMLFPQFGTYIERFHKVIFGLCTMFIECSVLDYIKGYKTVFGLDSETRETVIVGNEFLLEAPTNLISIIRRMMRYIGLAPMVNINVNRDARYYILNGLKNDRTGANIYFGDINSHIMFNITIKAPEVQKPEYSDEILEKLKDSFEESVFDGVLNFGRKKVQYERID